MIAIFNFSPVISRVYLSHPVFLSWSLFCYLPKDFMESCLFYSCQYLFSFLFLALENDHLYTAAKWPLQNKSEFVTLLLKIIQGLPFALRVLNMSLQNDPTLTSLSNLIHSSALVLSFFKQTTALCISVSSFQLDPLPQSLPFLHLANS